MALSATHPEILKRVGYGVVKDKSYPDKTEPPIGEYLKSNIIVPTQLIGTPSGVTGGGDGSKDNISSSAAEQIYSGAISTKWVLVQARNGNTGWVKVGFSTSPTVRLYAEDVVVLEIDNLNKIYVLSENGTEDVDFCYGG